MELPADDDGGAGAVAGSRGGKARYLARVCGGTPVSPARVSRWWHASGLPPSAGVIRRQRWLGPPQRRRGEGGHGRASGPRRPLLTRWRRLNLSLVHSGGGIPLDVSGSAQPTSFPAKPVFALLLSLAMTAVAVALESAGSGLIPVAWLAVGPLLASLVVRPRITAMLAGWAILLGLWPVMDQPGRPGGVVSHLSVWLLLGPVPVAHSPLLTTALPRPTTLPPLARAPHAASR